MDADEDQERATLHELASILADGGSDGGSRERDWSVVYAAASHGRKTEAVQRAVRDAVMHLLDGRQLRQAWTEVVALTRPPRASTAVAEKAATQLVTSYRWVVNYFATRTPGGAPTVSFPLAAADIVHRTARAFLEYVSSPPSQRAGPAGPHAQEVGSGDGASLCAVLFALPTEFQAAMLECMRQAPALAARGVVPALPAERALVLAVELLRRARGRSAALVAPVSTDPAPDDADTGGGNGGAGAVPLLVQLVERAVGGCHPLCVVDALLLQRPYAPAVAEFVMRCLPEGDTVAAVDAVLLGWGERLFVARGDHDTQQYLTAALLAGVARLSADALSARGPRGAPLAATLAAGVAVYLDQADRRSRLCGMRVARAFSRALGREVVFDELVAAEGEAAGVAGVAGAVSEGCGGPPGAAGAGAGAGTGTGTEGAADGLPPGQPRRRRAGTEGSDDSSSLSDGGSDIAAYDLGPEPPPSRARESTYLRGCLEILQAPEGDVDAYDKQQAALTSVPKVVANRPFDANDTVAPLVKELLRQSNRFNTPDFDTLRDAAVHSLAVAYPLLAVPVLAWAMDSPDLPLAVKVHAIALLKHTALALAGMDGPSAPGAPADTAASPPPPAAAAQVLGKTTVKRPLTLAAATRRATPIRNDFGPVAPLFYYPVLRVCALAASGRPPRPENDPYADTRLTLPAEFTQLAWGDGAAGGELLLRRPAATPSAVLVTEYVPPGDGVAAVSPPGRSRIEEEGGDGLHSMVPAEALLALATFTACSVNTTSQRQFILDTLKVAHHYRDSPAPSVRRAALLAVHAALSSWLHQKERRVHGDTNPGDAAGGLRRGGGGGGALAALTDVFGTRSGPTGAGTGPGAGALDVEEDTLVGVVVDWVVAAAPSEVDVRQRALMHDVVRLGVQGYALLADPVDEELCM